VVNTCPGGGDSISEMVNGAVPDLQGNKTNMDCINNMTV